MAELIVQEMAGGGGLITRDDLARYQAKWRDPIGITYRGHTIYTMPPPSGGGVTLAEILNVMEGYAPLPPFGSARLMRSEEHTSELQSLAYLVCRLLLEKKNTSGVIHEAILNRAPIPPLRLNPELP